MTYTPTAGTLDEWAQENGYGLEINRSDSLWVKTLFTFGLYGAVLAYDSTDTSQSVTCGYGMIGMLDADKVTTGVAVYATNSPGLLISQAIIGANPVSGVGTPGIAAIATAAGGSLTPKVVVSSWSHRGTWSTGATSNGAGTLIVPATNPG
jgi:hypothetical protein